MRVEDIERTGERTLQAVLAGIDQVDAQHQIPLLRTAIDLGLDRVASAEEGYYDFLGECAMLASQNMQDVRLHDVERRLQRIENPDSPGTTEVLVETAIILGVELIVTIGAPWLVGPVLTLVSARLIARSSRVTARGTRRLTAARKHRTSNLDALEQDLLSAKDDLEEARRRLKGFVSPYAPEALVKEVRTATEGIRTAETARDLAGLSLADLEDSARVDALVAAYRDALAGKLAKLKSKPLADFLAGASGHTIKGRLGESSGQEVARLLIAAGKPAGEASGTLTESPFLSSTVVGAILFGLRERRLEAARGHSYTRLLLGRIADANFAADPLIQDVARGIFDAIAPLEDALALADVVRPVVVRGFEAELWHEWLSVTGALVVEPGQTFESGVVLEPGDLHDGHLVSRVVRAPSERFGGLPLLSAIEAVAGPPGVYEGTYYQGLSRISDHQATYLYDTFAANYFAVPENASVLAFTEPYDPVRYAEVLSRAPTTTGGVLSNFERQRRLDEMRVMIVIFFVEFVDRCRGKASYGAVSDATVLVDDYLSLLPQMSPTEPSDEAAEPTPEELAARIDAVFAQTGVGEFFYAGIAIAEFEGQLTLLEQKLWIFEFVHSQLSYEAAEAPDGKTVTEASEEISQLKQVVNESYEKLLAFLKAYQPEAVADFERVYRSRMLSLTSSPIGEPQPAKRRFP